MTETQKSDKQASVDMGQGLRRSSRPKTPSLLYADGFEDTQKIGKKSNAKNSRTKNNTEMSSLIEKESEVKSEDESINGIRGSDSRNDYNPEPDYYPFMGPNGTNGKPNDKQVRYVKFKCQVVEDNTADPPTGNQTDKEGTNNITSSEKSGYLTRKVRKKPAYHDDFAYGNEAKNLKIKPKGFQRRTKVATKPAKNGPASQDFLDVILSAALRVQAGQQPEPSPGLRSPGLSNVSSTASFHHMGKSSAQKYSTYEDRMNESGRKHKVSIKKEASAKSLIQNEDFYQRHLEYQDHFIQQATIKDDKVFLKHSQNMPIMMKYKKKKFDFRTKEMLNSKVFELHMNGQTPFPVLFENPNDNTNDGEWKKRLKIKENILALHFKEILKSHKPSILI